MEHHQKRESWRRFDLTFPPPPEVSLPEFQNTIADLRKEILEEVWAARPPEVTMQDLQKIKDDLTAKIQPHSKESSGQVHALKWNPPEGRTLDSFKVRTYAKRLNIIVFGITVNMSD